MRQPGPKPRAELGRRLFPALGVNEAPPQPVTQTLIGGVEARLRRSRTTSTRPSPAERTAHAQRERSESARYADRLADALLNGEPLESVRCE